MTLNVRLLLTAAAATLLVSTATRAAERDITIDTSILRVFDLERTP